MTRGKHPITDFPGFASAKTDADAMALMLSGRKTAANPLAWRKQTVKNA